MTMRVTWLGHSTVVLDLDGVRLVADPLVRPHNGILRRRPAPPAVTAWRGADAVLLSHLHHDHAEVGSLRSFRDVPVITAPANAAWVTRKGLRARGVDDGEWVAVGRDEQVAVRLVRAVHHGRPMPHRPNAATGHLVRGRSGVAWLAGDTALFPEMHDLPVLAGAPLDVAIVPIGGWGPRLGPGHLGPEEAAHACAMSGARWAVPVHWRTLHPPGLAERPPGWMDRPGPAFETALADRAPSCRAAVLAAGESLDVPGAD